MTNSLIERKNAVITEAENLRNSLIAHFATRGTKLLHVKELSIDELVRLAAVAILMEHPKEGITLK